MSNGSFIQHHRTSLITFSVGLGLAAVFVALPSLHRLLGMASRLGYPGMFLTGILYGSGLTASIATVVFVGTPQSLNPIIVGLLAGLGAALYDLSVFLVTRREAEHGWLAGAIARMRQRQHIPNWLTMILGAFILASPLPDELAAGLFGINHGKAVPFFLLSFASNTFGVFLLSGVL